MGVGTSNFVIRWINFLTMGAFLPAFFFTLMIIVALGYAGNWLSMLLAIAVIIFGVWMSTHHDSCRRSLTLPVLGLGAVIFINNWVLGRLEEQLHTVVDLSGYVVYHFGGNSGFHSISITNYAATFQISHGIKSSIQCISRKVKNLEYLAREVLAILVKDANKDGLKENEIKEISLSLIHLSLSSSINYHDLYNANRFIITNNGSGHSVPGLRCGYPAVNASYYDLSFHPISSNKDCKLYKNSRATKCYNCDSCKAGVAQYMKTEWRLVAIFNVVLFVVLSMIYFVGCCARRSAARSHSKA
ncbi:hypothetical protein POTOM_004413 [Populus tomentosa]|uniref:Tetraspanin-10 n=1 Tax=Populus tomentosa TaxID=118781 RepID=A0A8X8AF96_POPTO|nr:hypothetical protein POTOM_004413 [Populus tomentosa]